MGSLWCTRLGNHRWSMVRRSIAVYRTLLLLCGITISNASKLSLGKCNQEGVAMCTRNLLLATACVCFKDGSIFTDGSGLWLRESDTFKWQYMCTFSFEPWWFMIQRWQCTRLIWLVYASKMVHDWEMAMYTLDLVGVCFKSKHTEVKKNAI